MTPKTRPAKPEDLQALAEIWHQGWHQAHADHVPEGLVRQRTATSFGIRLERLLPDVITVGPIGAPLGFCAIRDNEIYQLYVGPKARGTGIAAALISQGVRRIFAEGHTSATLDVIPQNSRAIAFYQRMGWRRQSVEVVNLDTLTGHYPLRCLKMTKSPDPD